MAKLKEHTLEGFPGIVVLGGILIFGAVGVLTLLMSAGNLSPAAVVPLLGTGLLAIAGLKGLTVVGPNEFKVFTFFGNYSGTLKEPGFWWVNPLYNSDSLSLKTSNYETQKLKVNDSHGNPIEIAAVVVWRIRDSAEALFNVEDYEAFMRVQSESALRGLASKHPYDQHEKGVLALRSDSDRVAAVLQKEIQERLDQAGIEIIEARLSHLAYAAEVASSMLKLQQASAVIAARQKIVEGAVSMVGLALDHIKKEKMAVLTPREKARLVSDLLVVLCGDREASPVISVGGGANP